MDLLSFSQRVAMIYHVVLFGYYRPPMTLWECNVFSRVCLSVHIGRGWGGFQCSHIPMMHWTSTDMFKLLHYEALVWHAGGWHPIGMRSGFS